MRRGGTSPSHAVRAFGVGTGRCRARHISDYHHESLRPRPRRHVDLPAAGERWNVTTHPAHTITNDGNRPAVSGALKKASFAISLILFMQFAQPFSVARIAFYTAIVPASSAWTIGDFVSARALLRYPSRI